MNSQHPSLYFLVCPVGLLLEVIIVSALVRWDRDYSRRYFVSNKPSDFQRGYDWATDGLTQGRFGAYYLEAVSDGACNETAKEDEFDRGARKALSEYRQHAEQPGEHP